MQDAWADGRSGMSERVISVLLTVLLAWVALSASAAALIAYLATGGRRAQQRRSEAAWTGAGDADPRPAPGATGSAS
jgi:hypothetical protein